MDDTQRVADTARIVQSGDTQIVELPSGYVFDTDTVQIRREGNTLVLEPVEDEWGWLEKLVEKFDDDVLAAMEEEVPQQERPELDKLFK